MANKQVNELVELTSLASDDLFIAYDTSEPGTEKVKKISATNAFIGYATDDELLSVSGALNISKEPVFVKNNAFNKNFGTASGTVCEGNDSRLSNAREPLSHGNAYHSSEYITTAGVTYTNLNNNSSVGTGSTQVARGDHTHDDRYYTEGEVDTISGALNTKISNKFDSAGGNISGNVTIGGDLAVNGTTFTVNTETVTAEDNLIVINSAEAGAGVTAGQAGIEVERGTEINYQFLFDENQDNFRVGVSGSLQAVATRQDSPSSTGVAFWNASSYRMDTDSNLTYASSILSSPYLKATGSTKTSAALYAGSTDPDGTTRLNYDGYFYATRVYNATWNDIADFQLVYGDQIPGKCYYDTLEGAKVCTERCQKSTIGVLSDTFGFGVGANQAPQFGPFAVAGWVLAFVDVPEGDTIEPGDPLTSNSTGNLVRMSDIEKKEFPERIIATYKKPESAEFWGPNNEIQVNGRHWVKVK